MKKILLTVITSLTILVGTQKVIGQINVHTDDLTNFYQTFDKVIATNDSITQIELINKLYIEKASKGLKDIINMKGLKTKDWKNYMINSTQSIIEKKPWILSVLNQKPLIEQKIEKFKMMYPDFRAGDIYFIVGVNNMGGTINDNTVYIGTEVLATNKPNWAVSTVLHEFTHTQQWTQRNMVRLMSDENLVKDYMSTHTQLLGRCLEEGLADFVSELVNGESLAKTNPGGHTAFGLKNEKAVIKLFKNEMFLKMQPNLGWLNTEKKEINGEKISDLGYFVGHQICKKYYNNSKDKKKALKDMLELNFTDEISKQFLISSGYISKDDIEKSFMEQNKK